MNASSSARPTEAWVVVPRSTHSIIASRADRHARPVAQRCAFGHYAKRRNPAEHSGRKEREGEGTAREAARGLEAPSPGSPFAMAGRPTAADILVWGILTFGVVLAVVLFLVQRLR
jgi:glutathione S-transferase